MTERELEDILDPTEDPPDAPRTTDFVGESFRWSAEGPAARNTAAATARLRRDWTARPLV
jgi:hypothetical protein